MSEKRVDVFPILLLLGAAVLLLWRLDDVYLWQDEAETALVARHLLRFGLPLSSDGRVWVQQSGLPFVEFTADYVWIYHSWLQYALVAISFAVLGATTLAARLPFALVGIASVGALYALALRWTSDRRVARVASLLLVLNVPFLLLMRQCRYYSLAVLFTLVTVDAYWRLLEGRSWALAYLTLASVLLYHSHYGAFFPTMAALGLHLLMARPTRVIWSRLLAAFGLIGAIVLPWSLFMRVLHRGGTWQLDRFIAHLGQDVLYLTGWVFPLVFLVLLGILCCTWLPDRLRWQLSAGQTRVLQVCGALVACTVVLLSASAAFDWAFFRYLVQLMPMMMIVLAMLVVWIMDRWRVLGYAVVVLLVSSNILHVAPYALVAQAFSSQGTGERLDLSTLRPGSEGFRALNDVWVLASRFRSDAWMYLQELTHDYVGPNEGLVAYLSAHATPGQTLVVNYEDLPLSFYTDLQVLGGMSQHGLGRARPDWIVDRKNGPYRNVLADIVASGAYVRIELPYPDIRWENRPEPGTHQYLTAQGGDFVVIYQRKER
jgi:4-amino-4-deoxy-L-arabinose transferase-like glycosyltransferase